MTKLEKIEREIASLSKTELIRLADWFAAFHAEVWDRQLKADAESGRLDSLAEKALADHKAGRSSPL